MNLRTTTLSTAAALTLGALTATLYAAPPARGSDHQDTLALVSKPGADITDLYVFPAKDPKNVVFALDVHPLIPRGMSATATFDPGVMYQIKIDTVGDYRQHQVLQFKAEGAGADQKITLYGPAAPQTSGLNSKFVAPLGATTYNTRADLGNGITLFAGARKDPFYFDLGQFFKLNPDRDYKNHPDVPPPSATCFRGPDDATDFLKDFNVLSLVVEMPRSLLQTPANKGRINVWATTSVPAAADGLAYEQIERFGRRPSKKPSNRSAITPRPIAWNLTPIPSFEPRFTGTW